MNELDDYLKKELTDHVVVEGGKANVKVGQEVSYEVSIPPYDSVRITGEIASVRPLRVRVTKELLPMVRIRPGYLLPIHDGTVLAVIADPIKQESSFLGDMVRRFIGA